MDIAAHPKLDPKLKETYDRIMGTSVGVKTPHTALGQVKADTTPSVKSQNDPAHNNESATEKKIHESAEPKSTHTAGSLSHIAYSASSAKKTEEKRVPKEVSHAPAITTDSLLFPIIMGAGGVIFFVFYAIFWISFFGI